MVMGNAVLWLLLALLESVLLLCIFYMSKLVEWVFTCRGFGV